MTSEWEEIVAEANKTARKAELYDELVAMLTEVLNELIGITVAPNDLQERAEALLVRAKANQENQLSGERRLIK
jgi:hypothetical protein